MNNPKYEVWVRDGTTGLIKAFIDDYTKLQFRPTVNNYAGLTLVLHQDSQHVSNIEFLDRIEVVRKITNPLALNNNSINIVLNPGFEESGSVETFDKWESTPGLGTIEDETSYVHSGYHAVKMTSGAVTEDCWIDQEDCVAIPGTSFTMTFWTRGDGTNCGKYGVWDNTNETDIIVRTDTGITGTEYTKVSCTFTVPPGCTAPGPYFEPPDVIGGYAYFDDCRIGPAEVDEVVELRYGYIVLGKERQLDEGGKSSEKIVIYGLSLNAYLASRVIIPPSSSESGGSFKITASDDSTTFTLIGLANNGFETAGAGGADIFGSWSETAGDGTISDEGTIVHGGSHAAKLTAGASANTKITQDFTVSSNKQYMLTFWTRGDSVGDGRYDIYDVTNSADIVSTTSTGVTGTTYTRVSEIFWTPDSCVSVRIILRCPTTNTKIAYFDDVYLIPVLMNGDKIIPDTDTSEERVVKATLSSESVSVTSAFSKAISEQTFTILRAHSTYRKLADNLMKQLVRDCITNATDTSRNISGISTDSDSSESLVTVSWSVRYKLLIDELRSIADSSDCDFELALQDDGTIKFVTYYPQMGEDRREGNTEGNTPIIFSVERDNIRGQRWWSSALPIVESGGNALYVAGAGDGANREIRITLGTSSIDSWGRWEKFVDARDAQTSQELIDRAASKINEMSIASTGIHFEAMTSDSCIWGLHYNLGDLITVKAWNEGLVLSDQIVAIEVEVDENGMERVFPVVGSQYPNFTMKYTKLRKNVDQISVAD